MSPDAQPDVRQAVDLPTIIGWGMLLMPLLTMWHEIGGHALACVVQGGHVATIGAFYVDCSGLSGLANIIVAGAGVFVDALLALAVFLLWRQPRADHGRLALWLIWVSKAFVAAGYLAFSGVTGAGDLGTGAGGGLATLPQPLLVRLATLAVGIAAYGLLVRAAMRTLDAMIGTGLATRRARRRIAHGYYASAGLGAVIVGLLNPVGMFITIMSAAASSFGGLAGLISVGFASAPAGTARAFVVDRSAVVIGLGAAVLAAFAIVLGPSLNF